MIYSYIRTIVEGPNGTTYTLKGGEGTVELSDLDGRFYVYAPQGANVPEQLPEIDLQEELTLDSATIIRLLRNNPNVQFIERQIDAMLDAKSKEYGYDSIVHACLYASAPNYFQDESTKFVQWCGAVWGTCYATIDAVLATEAPFPTLYEVMQALPKFEVSP